MPKKSLHASDIDRLCAARTSPHLSTEQLLSHSILACVIVQALGPDFRYGRFFRFADLIEGLTQPSHDLIAPICVFAKQHDVWRPAVVVECADAPNVEKEHALHLAGIAYAIATPEQVASGYVQSDDFKASIKQAVFNSSVAPGGNGQEEFQSEPKPIYPPRRCIAGN